MKRYNASYFCMQIIQDLRLLNVSVGGALSPLSLKTNYNGCVVHILTHMGHTRDINILEQQLMFLFTILYIKKPVESLQISNDQCKYV